MSAFSMTVVATTGERFSDFAPYVASVNDAGTVAFQAALRSGGSGVFTGSGGAVTETAGPGQVAAVTSHPDLNDAGAMCFYGELDEAEVVFLLHDGRLQTIADTRGPFQSIGPLGPTMNEAGIVAFRADRAPLLSGIYTGGAETIETVAEAEGPWSRFHGLPVINGEGTVVFRADRADAVQGIYAARAGSIRAVAETGEVFETLAFFPSVNDQGRVAFAATLRAGGAGIFVSQDGQITPLLDTGSAFESFRGALISGGGEVIGVGTATGGSLGVFAGPDPDADRIIGIGDSLLGSTVAELAANPVSVNAPGQVAIRTLLADGTQVILRADPVR